MRQVTLLLIYNHLDCCLRKLEPQQQVESTTQLRSELLNLVTQVK
jgi:hypothetical protein